MSRTLSIAAIAVAGAALCGCASTPAAPTYAWSHQQVEGEGEKLAYGAPNSDDVLLMMVCAPGSGRVLLSALGETSDIVLASGKGRERFAGHAFPDDLGGSVVEAEVPARAQVLSRFAETGELALVDQGQEYSLSAGVNDREGVQRFFQTCA